MIVTADNLGQWGVLRDGLPHELPNNAWSDGRNVRFREGYAEKFAGHAEAYGESLIVPYHVHSLNVGATRWWIEMGLTAIYSVDNLGVHTDISSGAYTGTVDDRWTSTTLGGIAVLNNGKNVPQAWGGTGLCTNLPAWPSTLRAKSIRAFRNFLVAVNVSKDSGATWYPHMVKWSTTADPGSVPSSWDETDPATDAGEADLSDHPSELVDALVMGDSLILYKEGAYYALQDVGGLAVFRAQMLSSEMGMLARNCAASFPGGHVVLGQGDVFVHSGGAPETILTARARRWLFGNIDANNYARSFVVANPLANEIWICFPEINESACTKALVWNWQANTIGVRELPDATGGNTGVVDANLADTWDAADEPWASDPDKWNQAATTRTATRLNLSSLDSRILLVDSTAEFAGTPVSAMLERTGLSLDAPDKVKLIRGVRPIFDGSIGGTVQIQVGASMEPQTPPTWSDPVDFTLGETIQADTYAAGRFLALRITSDTAIQWRIKRLLLDVELQGGW